MGIIFHEGKRNQASDCFNHYDGYIAIEYRGSATAIYPKKQYRFETQNQTGENFNVSLLGLPKENDWILYGPYADKSLIRDVIAFKISNEMGRYASRTRFCELMLNGDYQGLYVLMEKIKRDKNRVNIREMSNSDNTGANVSGGYIIKIDKYQGENVGVWRSENNINYQYHYPAADEITSQQKEYIQNFMNSFESVMIGPDFNDPNRGYLQYLDIDSFVDHFLINELFKNVDAFRISAFLYKDRDTVSDKLFAGPVWDFNLTMGNAWYEQDIHVSKGWQVDYNETHSFESGGQVPFWWVRLGHDYYFQEKLEKRWSSLHKSLFSWEYLFKWIDMLADSISEARERNFQRWPESAPSSYEGEIDMMKNWLVNRIYWINHHISELAADVAEKPNIPVEFSLAQNYPNPFNTQTVIKFKLDQTTQVILAIYGIDGSLICKLSDGMMNSGEMSVLWNGTNNRGKKVPSGLYICSLRTGYYHITKKMLLVN